MCVREIDCYTWRVQKLPLVIVTPALKDANNGNWQTAKRWAGMLSSAYRVHLKSRWPDGNAGADARLMIALHARRSAQSIANWRDSHPELPLVLVLTGTDLYHDILRDRSAQQSLEFADALVVLNEMGKLALPERLRAKCHVILQSCAERACLPKTRRHLRALMVGHLRQEKDPLTYIEAARILAARKDIILDHVGAALEPTLGKQARASAASQANYHWFGAVPHTAARRKIQAAHVLVHPSQLEGGAHVVMEAIRSGTPVLASRIDGNIGLLGSDYGGYFAPGDAKALAALIAQVRDNASLLDALGEQIRLRSPLFDPLREADLLRHLITSLLQSHQSH